MWLAVVLFWSYKSQIWAPFVIGGSTLTLALIFGHRCREDNDWCTLASSATTGETTFKASWYFVLLSGAITCFHLNRVTCDTLTTASAAAPFIVITAVRLTENFAWNFVLVQATLPLLVLVPILLSLLRPKIIFRVWWIFYLASGFLILKPDTSGALSFLFLSCLASLSYFDSYSLPPQSIALIYVLWGRLVFFATGHQGMQSFI
jgi:hypothetical protein